MAQYYTFQANMSCKKSNKSELKRTSHYYKKKLSEPEQDDSIDQEVKKSKTKIQKKPKQAKLRAKQARQRKKKYIERLEQKIQSLQKQLQLYRNNPHLQCKAIQSQNSAFSNLNNNINNNHKTQKQTQFLLKEKLKTSHGTEFIEEIVKLEGIQGAFKRLYRAVSERNLDEAVYSISVLREQFGVAGNERKKWIKQLVMKVVDIQMPLHCRLLLQHCQNRKFFIKKGEQFYKLLGGSESLRQFRKVYFDQNAISTICQSRSSMMQIKQQYKRILLNLQQLSHEMFQQAHKLQSQIDRIQLSMNPLFVGRILVYLDMQRKETQNLQQIFPVNFYKRSLIQGPEHRQRMKYECDIDLCKQREEDRLQRLSMLSDEENFLKDFFND